jgi:predicted peptidase
MSKITPFLMAAALLALTACTSTKPAAFTEPQTQMAKQFKLVKRVSLEANYLLHLPPGYDANPEQRWPLILFLHGAGERGTNVWDVAKHGPPHEVTAHPDFPFILVSPQCPNGRIWSDDVLLALLDDIEQRYRVDLGRVYLTGLSMGGYGTWSLGIKYPERFAAIAPLCGGGELISLLLTTREKAESIRTLGVWAFHGAKDPVVPPSESQRMVDFLKKSGVRDSKLTIYPEALHDCWTQTYSNQELYKWFLKHDRKPE